MAESNQGDFVWGGEVICTPPSMEMQHQLVYCKGLVFSLDKKLIVKKETNNVLKVRARQGL